MNKQASQQFERSSKGVRIKCTKEDIEVIFSWIMYRDQHGELVNYLLYLKGDKAEASKQLLIDTGMGETKVGMTKGNLRDKIGSMTDTHKKWRNIADETGWGLDLSKHDQTQENTGGETIREVLLQRCSWFYEFEEIMGDSPGIHPPFIMESGFEIRETSEPNRLYQDIDEESYDDWLEGGHDQDRSQGLETNSASWLSVDGIHKRQAEATIPTRKVILRKKKIYLMMIWTCLVYNSWHSHVNP